MLVRPTPTVCFHTKISHTAFGCAKLGHWSFALLPGPAPLEVGSDNGLTVLRIARQSLFTDGR